MRRRRVDIEIKIPNNFIMFTVRIFSLFIVLKLGESFWSPETGILGMAIKATIAVFCFHAYASTI